MSRQQPKDGKQGSAGRSATTGKSGSANLGGGVPAGQKFESIAGEICSCGVPKAMCPGHHEGFNDKLPPAAPTSFMPKPYTLGD